MKTTKPSRIVTALTEANSGRKPDALQVKYQRMAASPFAFFRGTDGLLVAAWDRIHPPDVGPSILSCGDLHLENYGAYRAVDGSIRFDVNDFDEAALAPCSFDLTRCTASILLASEEWQLGPLTATGMAIGFLDAYRAALMEAKPGAMVVEPGNSASQLLGLSSLKTHEAVLALSTQLQKGKHRIKRDPVRHPEVSRDRVAKVTEAVQSLGIGAQYDVLDVTGRIAGVGSLGLRRYLVLTRGDGAAGGAILLDIKECAPSALASFSPEKKQTDDAERVVSAQTRLQSVPAMGLQSLKIGKRSYRARWMVPEENRSSLDRFKRDPKRLMPAVQIAGQLAGWMQMRGAGTGKSSSLLKAWAAGSALDAILMAAARAAEQTRIDFQEYVEAWRAGAFR